MYVCMYVCVHIYIYICIHSPIPVNGKVLKRRSSRSDVTYCRHYIMTRQGSFLLSADKPSAVCKAVQLKSAAGDHFLHLTHVKNGSN